MEENQWLGKGIPEENKARGGFHTIQHKTNKFVSNVMGKITSQNPLGGQGSSPKLPSSSSGLGGTMRIGSAMSGGATGAANSGQQMRTRQFLNSGGSQSNMAMNPQSQKKVYKFSLNHSKTNVNTSANTSQQRIMNTSGNNYNTQSD